MSDDRGAGCATRKAPRVVFGGGPGFADRVANQFRLLGWDVCTAATADELHRKVARKNPAAVVLPAASVCESGFLTAAKLRLTQPRLRVVLVGEPTGPARRLAGFVGAGFATEDTAADAVMKLI
ncbi:MAG: hypothetical protein K2X87_32620 [Gemmataceae bacterium]|nr:hypothetical protein [Gemmataceae bacterium]